MLIVRASGIGKNPLGANQVIPLSLKDIAKYMTSDSHNQRKILMDHKFPKDKDDFSPGQYYAEAKSSVVKYHKHNYGPIWLESQANRLKTEAISGETTSRKTRLQNNARVLLDYQKNFSQHKIELLKVPRLELVFYPVVISATPDMFGVHNKKERLIKLELNKEEPDQEAIKIICQCLFEAQLKKGLGLGSSSVLYWDVGRGTPHTGARLVSRRRKQIEAACKNIASIWNDLEKED